MRISGEETGLVTNMIDTGSVFPGSWDGTPSRNQYPRFVTGPMQGDLLGPAEAWETTYVGDVPLLSDNSAVLQKGEQVSFHNATEERFDKAHVHRPLFSHATRTGWSLGY
jgi:hypothetical protein